MTNPHGAFIWYELLTSDPQAAAAFYGSVIGWQARDAGNPDMAYTLLGIGEDLSAGLMALQPGMGGGPVWLGYVAVDDVDAAAAKAASLGGTLHQPPHDIPGVGRFAVIADPQGAVLALFKGGPDWTVKPAWMFQPGRAGWHELYAADGATAFDFYGQMFGWTKGEAMDMGPMGTYQLFNTPVPDAIGGGIMTKPAEAPVPSWGFYFQVPAVDAALQRIKDGGGTPVNGPMEVPGGAWIVQALDPQGALFAIVGQRG